MKVQIAGFQGFRPDLFGSELTSIIVRVFDQLAAIASSVLHETAAGTSNPKYTTIYLNDDVASQQKLDAAK